MESYEQREREDPLPPLPPLSPSPRISAGKGHAYFVLKQALAARFGEPPRREAERTRAAPEECFQRVIIQVRSGQAANPAAFERRDREAIAEKHAIGRDGCDPGIRGDDADEIERVGAGERDELRVFL